MNGGLSAEAERGNGAQARGEGEQSTTDDPTARVSDQQRLSKDVIFGLLSNRRRRGILKYLATNGPETTLNALAEDIAAGENDTEIELLTSQQRKRVYVALYQVHLPKMDDADVIDFESTRGTVEIRPNAAQLYRYLEMGSADPTESTQEGESAGRFTAIRSKVEEWVPKSG
jgi:hypothetical protein